MRASKLYPFSIPANGSVNFLVEGNYFKIKSSTGSITVVGDTFGALGGMLQGQGLRDTDFRRLTLQDETGAINNGYLLVSDGNFVDDRITGEVSIIDSQKSRTLSGSAFGGFGYQGAVAAQFSRVQLVNANTTKRIIIEQLAIITGPAANAFHLRFGLGALGTLVQTGVGKDTIATSVAQVKTDTTAAASGSTGQVFAGSQSASVTSIFVPKTPYILPPSATFTVYGTIANADLGCTFDYWEETV